MNYCIEDLGIVPSELTGKQIVEHLDKRIQDVLKEITTGHLWKFITDPNTDPADAARFMKEIYLEIVMYQPDAIEAAIAIIGQMPRKVPATTVAIMLHQQSEEFDHGEMALRDYIGLGGSEEEARKRRLSPSSFQIAAMWHFLSHKRDPFAYLGAEYLFEGLTPIITGMVKSFLKDKGMKRNSLEFIDYHSTADIEHTDTMRKLIEEIATNYPESKESICYGFEYFKVVYPIPAWSAALKRAVGKKEYA